MYKPMRLVRHTVLVTFGDKAEVYGKLLSVQRSTEPFSCMICVIECITGINLSQIGKSSRPCVGTVLVYRPKDYEMMFNVTAAYVMQR